MPQIIPAVAAAVSWVSSAAAAASAAVVGWMATPFVMAMGEGAAIAMASGVLKVAATALGSYALNAVMAPKVGGGGSPTQFKADPQSPIRGVMGRFGTSGTQAHMRVWGKNNLMISYMVVLSLGPIQGVEKFTANGLQVNFTGPNGLAANVEPYKDKMWMTYKNGLPTDGSLMPPPTGGNPTMEWTGNHKTSGYAGAFWTMQNNSKRASYEGGVPKPVWTVGGMLCYDPRLDSTQIEIGGSGPHRVDDWRTWTYSQNPQIHAINWALGHYKKLPAGIIDRNFLLAGIGAPITSIHLPSLVAGANVSDANGWKICGEWNTQDDKWNTFASMLQAGGSAPIHVGAKIGIMTNAPRVPVATITDEDVTGNLNIKVMAPSRDRFNTIYPMYISEPNGWEYATAGAVTSTVYQAEDGGEERPKEMKYNFVGQSKQARELAAYDLANTRETMKLAFPAKPYLIGVRAGDAVNVDMPRRGIVGKFIVLARPLELGEGAISFELRSESDAKHPWALGQTDQPAPSPSLSPFDPSPSSPEGWVVTPRPPESGGTQQPGFIVIGEVPDGIGSVLFEVGSSTSGPWRQVYSGPPTTERVNIDNLAPLETYWVRVTYYSIDGVPSEPTVYGPYTAPDFIAKGEVTFPDGTSPIWNYEQLSDLPNPPDSDNQTQAYVAETGKLYSWNPDTNVWEPMVADATIEDGTLTNAKFVSGLRAAGLGPSLPALPSADWPEGTQFVLTTDGKTYTNVAGAWKTGVAAADIEGAIQAAQVAGVNAAAVIGQMVAEQLADSAVTSDKIASNAIVAGKIAANAIVSGNIVSGAINTTHLAAGSVVASKMLVGDTSNMVPDGAIVDPASWIFSASTASIVTASPDSTSKNRFNVLPSTADVNVYSSWVPVEQNAEMFFSAVMGYGTGTIGGGSYVYLQTGQDDGSGNVSGTADNTPTAVQNTTTRATFGQSIVVPSGHNVARLRFRRVTGGTATALFDSPIIRRRASGELIVDGAITTDKLAANSIVAGKVAAGAINGTHISAGAITTSKLAVGDYSNLVNDGFSDEAFWNASAANSIYQSLAVHNYKKSWRWSQERSGMAAYAFVGDLISNHFAVEEGVDYYFSAGYRFINSARGRYQIWVYWHDGQGTQISSPTIANISTTGAELKGVFGGVVKSPSGAATARFRIRVLADADGNHVFGGYFFDPVVRRAASGELIVDGAITATKIATNAVTADKIVAGAVTAAKINVTQLSAITADMGIITAGMIRSGTTGLRTEIDKNGGRSYHANGQLAVRWGIW